MRAFIALFVAGAFLGCSGPEPVRDAPASVSGVDFSGFDESVRPQDDFNAYVNGRWLATTPIPADKRSWGSGPIVNEESEQNQRAILEELAEREDLEPGTDEQRVGDLFASFLDTSRLEEIGATPVEEELAAVLEASDVPELVRRNAAQRAYGIDGPLALAIFPDLGDSSRYAPYLFQAGLTLPDRDYYLKDDEKFESVRSALPGYATTLFELAGVDDASARGQAVLEVETLIAEPQWSAQENRNVQRLYNLFKVLDLGSASDRIDWEPYLQASGLTDVEDIVLAQPSYVSAFGELLGKVSLEDWKSYFAFRLLDDKASYLSDAFVQAQFEFHGKLVGGLEELSPRWQRGVRNVNALIGEAVGKVYVERHFPPASKARMEEMVQNLIEAFGEAIDELDWMTDATKERAQAKRQKFTYKIGYPDEWRDYSSLEIDREDLVGNVARAQAFEYRRNIAKLGAPIDKSEWSMTPQTVNAYHNPTMNEIVFPAGILQPPFFNPEADEAANYGAIGAVIGHEIGHAFDDQGRQFDGDGNLSDWWTEEDAASYADRARKLADQYNGFEALPGLNVNGQLTLGENIGDLTGVTIAYRAYLKSFGGAEAPVIDGRTGTERFFMGFAQLWRTKYRDELMRELVVSNPHSPPEFRVNGPLRNSPEFYEVFGVSEGDGMWLPEDERVKIW